jgi:hypothetical protein
MTANDEAIGLMTESMTAFAAQMETIQQTLALMTTRMHPTPPTTPPTIPQIPPSNENNREDISTNASMTESADQHSNTTIHSPEKKKQKPEAPGDVQYKRNTDPAGGDKC